MNATAGVVPRARPRTLRTLRLLILLVGCGEGNLRALASPAADDVARATITALAARDSVGLDSLVHHATRKRVEFRAVASGIAAAVSRQQAIAARLVGVTVENGTNRADSRELVYDISGPEWRRLSVWVVRCGARWCAETIALVDVR